MVKALGTAGYKTQVQTLSHYHNDYGLEANEEEEEEEEDDEDEDMEDGSEESGSDEDSDL